MKNDEFVWMIFVIAAIIVAVLYSLSKWMGVPFDTLIRVIGWLAVLLATVIALGYLGVLKNLWPWSIGFIYVSFWPAINHWTLKIPGFSDEVSFWGEWYTKMIIFIILVALGYALKAWISNRNSNRW